MPGPLLPLAGVVWGNIWRCHDITSTFEEVKIGTSEMTLQIKLSHGFENGHETIPWVLRFGDWIPIGHETSTKPDFLGGRIV